MNSVLKFESTRESSDEVCPHMPGTTSAPESLKGSTTRSRSPRESATATGMRAISSPSSGTCQSLLSELNLRRKSEEPKMKPPVSGWPHIYFKTQFYFFSERSSSGTSLSAGTSLTTCRRVGDCDRCRSSSAHGYGSVVEHTVESVLRIHRCSAYQSCCAG